MTMGKKLLFMAMVLGMLAVVAVPVLAAEPVTMWVHQTMVTYTGRSSGGPDSMMAYAHIRDANYERVAGATVTATWTLPSGETVVQPAVTTVQGIAKFYIFAGAGNYTFCVDDVQKENWEYDATLNGDNTCASYVLPPYNPAW